jgi:hypothetical protein
MVSATLVYYTALGCFHNFHFHLELKFFANTSIRLFKVFFPQSRVPTRLHAFAHLPPSIRIRTDGLALLAVFFSNHSAGCLGCSTTQKRLAIIGQHPVRFLKFTHAPHRL